MRVENEERVLFFCAVMVHVVVSRRSETNARELKLDTCLLIMLFGHQGLGSRHDVAYADMCGLELPLFRVVYDLIHGNIDAREAPQYLMGRPLLQETSRAHMACTSLS